MPTEIKICGITKLSEVEFLNETDVDYIGFVFAESKREITIEQAKLLSHKLNPKIKKCGIFVSHTTDEINEIAEEVGLDIAQVHGKYSPRMSSEINIPVWYAVNIKDSDSIKTVNEVSCYWNVTGVVADAYTKGQMGGTGKTFNWDLLKDIKKDTFLILAGGLKEDNVKEAMMKVNPNVIDISSGAEVTINDETIKSEELVRSLIRKVKNNDTNKVR